MVDDRGLDLASDLLDVQSEDLGPGGQRAYMVAKLMLRYRLAVVGAADPGPLEAMGLLAVGIVWFAGVSLAINLESEAEVDRVALEWVSCGGTLIKQPHRAFWGGYSGYVADPDGHLWELAYNPGFLLLADGSMQLPS